MIICMKVIELMERVGMELTEAEKSALQITYEVSKGKAKFRVRRPIQKVPYKEPTIEDYQKEEVKTEKPEDEKEFIQTMTPNGVQLVEKMTLYVDLDNSEVYGKNYLFKRFNMDKLSDKVVIDGFSCYKMSNDYVEYIVRNQNNN